MNFGIKFYMFRTVPLSTVRSFSLYTQQWYMSYRFADSLLSICQQTSMTYTVAVCTVKNFWWWTEELSETCRACSQAVSKPVWHIPVLCVQWKTPDGGQRNCPKHVKFYSKNKFAKLVHLLGFIIKIYHDARSPERQKKKKNWGSYHGRLEGGTMPLTHSSLILKTWVLVLTSVHHFVPFNTSLACNFIHRAQFHALAFG